MPGFVGEILRAISEFWVDLLPEYLGYIQPFITFFLCLFVIYRRRAPAVSLAWMLAAAFIPKTALFFYLFFGYHNFSKRRRLHRARNAAPNLSNSVSAATKGFDPKAPTRRAFSEIAVLSEQLTGFAPLAGNRVDVLDDARTTYESIATDIKAARSHIHLEYYIFQPDETGRYFRDLLIMKSGEGVKCRVLVDALGSRRLSRAFLRPMIEAGVVIQYFNRAHVPSFWRLNLRNHRKIVVIDGHIGFIGSQNIGNEYVHWKSRHMEWQDTMLRIQGPAVQQLQVIFAEDWHFASGVIIEEVKSLSEIASEGHSVVQTVPTGPDEDEHALQMITLSAIYAARERVTMTSPYFLPTESMVMALRSAVGRGVQVDVVLPTKSDHPITSWAARSWYQDLVESGVTVAECDDAFLHAKVITVDHGFATVGSANMDERSFRLNFEAGVIVYDEQVVSRLVRRFDATLSQSTHVTKEHLSRYSILERFTHSIFRLVTPLL